MACTQLAQIWPPGHTDQVDYMRNLLESLASSDYDSRLVTMYSGTAPTEADMIAAWEAEVENGTPPDAGTRFTWFNSGTDKTEETAYITNDLSATATTHVPKYTNTRDSSVDIKYIRSHIVTTNGAAVSEMNINTSSPGYMLGWVNFARRAVNATTDVELNWYYSGTTTVHAAQTSRLDPTGLSSATVSAVARWRGLNGVPASSSYARTFASGIWIFGKWSVQGIIGSSPNRNAGMVMLNTCFRGAALPYTANKSNYIEGQMTRSATWPPAGTTLLGSASAGTIGIGSSWSLYGFKSGTET